MSAPLRLSLVVMLLLAAGPSAQPRTPVSGTQQPASPQAPAPQPRFRAGTTLVTVDAIVRDNHGRFVADLRPDDFEVLEDGKPQTIESFYVVTGGTVRAAPAPAAVPPAVPSQRVSPPAPPQVQRVFVLLFDQQHMAPGGFKRAQQAAVAFLETGFQTGDVGGVVGGGTMVGHRLTSSREERQAAVRSLQASAEARSVHLDMRAWPRFLSDYEAWRIADGDNEVLAQVAQRACLDNPDLCKPDPSWVTQMVRNKAGRLASDLRASTMRTIHTLTGLIDGLVELPGRKTIVLLSDGFFADREWANLRQATERAARASVRVYALDTRGLNRGSASSDIFEVPPHAAVNPAGDPIAYDVNIDFPNSLSVDTGGYMIRNENDFTKALDEIAADTSSYYVLGYAPTNATYDGKFRTIAVDVTRPGLHVRARKGYLATPDLTAEATVPTEAESPPEPPAGEAADTAEPAAPPAPEKVENALAQALASASAAAPDMWNVLLPPPPGTTPPASPMLRLAPMRERPTEAARLHEAPARPLPESLAVRARRGWDAYQRGDVGAARIALAAVAEDPAAPPWVCYVLGWSHYALGDYVRAAAVWQRVLDAVPEFEPVYFDLADAYLQQKAYDTALGLLRAAGARWPADAEILDAQGVIQTTDGALDDAVKSFEGALAVAPDSETSHFNLARACELRYLRLARAFDADPVSVHFDTTDRVRAVGEFGWVAAKDGPLAGAARDGLRRMKPVDVKTLRFSRGTIVASFDRDRLGAAPDRLAWSTDGARLYLRGADVDEHGHFQTSVHAVVRLPGDVWRTTPNEPAWATDYWRWKSASIAPWIPTLRFTPRAYRPGPLGSFAAPISQLWLKDHFIVVPTPRQPAGYTFSWAPYAMGAIAFVDKKHRLTIVDQEGHTRTVPATKDVLLPAWSPDGTRIAWVQRAGGNRFVILVIDVREHN